MRFKGNISKILVYQGIRILRNQGLFHRIRMPLALRKIMVLYKISMFNEEDHGCIENFIFKKKIMVMYMNAMFEEGHGSM